MLIENLEGLSRQNHHVCVVGAGPVGMVLALELARLKQKVTLLESGLMQADPAIQELSDALRVDQKRSADMSLVVQRSFGGTSNLWGAGCVPLDPIDFEERCGIDARWPLSYEEFAEHLEAACRYANCGPVFEHAAPGGPIADDRFTIDRLMRYADPPSFRKAHGPAVASSSLISAYLGATVTGFSFAEDGRVRRLRIRGHDGSTHEIAPRIVVIACGGVETTRLLLNAQAEAPMLFGGEGGPLGRYYMGHLSGSVAEIHFADPAIDRSFDFFRLDGCYARRRLMASGRFQKEAGLTNVAFWPTMPPMRDASHRDPILSMAYLALSIPPLGRLLVSESLRRSNVGDGRGKLKHLANAVLGLPRIATFLPHFLYGRFLASRRLPGLHLLNGARRYVLHYHAEHLPNPQSRIYLSNERDRMGLRKAVLDLRFDESDADPIVRTHDHLHDWLTATGLGRLDWKVPPEQRLSRVIDAASDSVHQIGTTRMAGSPRDGVVDRDCRVFESANLFLASSAVFPTSGQANPTLSAITLGIRQAGLIAREASSHVN